MKMRLLRSLFVLPLILAPMMLSACADTEEEKVAESGRSLAKSAGCGTCHLIPHLPSANGHVGPPLSNFSKRSYIAGILPNTAENLTAWLQDPHSIDPDTAMPTTGLPHKQAEAIAAFLHTL